MIGHHVKEHSVNSAHDEPDSPEPRNGGMSEPHGRNPSYQMHPQGIPRVPTHAVGRAQERRAYARARLSLSLSVRRVAGQGANQSPLRTEDISSNGVFFLYPQHIDPGTPIELEVLLVDGAFGRGSVRMRTMAHVVRAETSENAGWHGLAATFDDISFTRDESIPTP
jgi:PilZ domain